MYKNFFFSAPICVENDNDACSHCGEGTEALYVIHREDLVKEEFVVHMECNNCKKVVAFTFATAEDFLFFIRLFIKDKHPLFSLN